MFLDRLCTGGLAVMLVAGLAGCGGGEPAQEEGGGGQQAAGAAAMGEMMTPDWMTVDEANRTVTLQIVAGQTQVNNRWNFNGYTQGNATVTVPQGYTVRIQFSNDDPQLAHSIGVDSRTGNFPASFTDPQPVFPGAMSSNPTSMTSATMPGASETIEFTAAQAGNYALVCYIPAHALAGMWIHFNVSAEGEVGVREG